MYSRAPHVGISNLMGERLADRIEIHMTCYRLEIASLNSANQHHQIIKGPRRIADPKQAKENNCCDRFAHGTAGLLLPLLFWRTS